MREAMGGLEQLQGRGGLDQAGIQAGKWTRPASMLARRRPPRVGWEGTRACTGPTRPRRFNKRESDFEGKREYDDYLEEREDISCGGFGMALPWGASAAGPCTSLHASIPIAR